ncbi:MAG: DUF1840 domain-containing protein [Burkholderiaceae bacterium]|nr:DUF1840 domain-containing protein [Burkholderiaceae bacterium]
MIYEFKSRATGSVIMTRPVAEWILQIIGKAPGRTGIITVDQMPAAVDALNRAIAQEKEELRAERRAMESAEHAPGGASEAEKSDADEDPYPVSLAQRAFPFIDLLKEAQKAGKDITWGV